MAMPTWSSIRYIFCWYDASSPNERYKQVIIKETGTHDCMIRTLRANKIACVFDRRPTAAEPCFTASRAYSTWCRRP